MNRFAELLDRLAYEPGRNNKLRLLTAYLRDTPDPDRGYALAALTGALSFKHAKPGLIRDLITDRTDPVLFGLSYDYVGDLSETVALMWPKAALPGHNNPPPPTLSEVVATLRTLGKTELPKQLARWLDELDETGRWALLKLVTGAMRIGISARLAKTAAAALGDKDPHDVELIWPGLAPPYLDLFAWLEGRGDKPVNRDPAPFRPVMLAHAIEDADFLNLDPSDFIAEWKWDGIRVQAVSGRDERGQMQARLYSRTGEDITGSFPDLVPSLHLPVFVAAGDGLHANAVPFPFRDEVGGIEIGEIRILNRVRQHHRAERRGIAVDRFFAAALQPGEQVEIGRRQPRPDQFDLVRVLVAKRGSCGFRQACRNPDPHRARHEF